MQLKMFRPYAPVPEIVFPEGYGVRALQPGEEVLYSVAALGSFVDTVDAEHYEKHMRNNGVSPRSVLLLTWHDPAVPDAPEVICGTATAQIRDERPYLHCVAIREEHRGKGLSFPLNASVLKLHEQRGRTDGCFLTTDDWRIPAICVYLRLGFLPVLWSDDAEARWTAIFEKLGRTGVRMLQPEEC